ncbi:LytR/AlgR family response regulator transcription factor [Larkinella humicola]|uniref:LytR/AlgR family response regulator transcription factor n=1 Tax=Larkinella humicola TaxID=2607654 RepID=UPI001CD943E2|nr:LytTR family DNA-binding domain-containing protein [Larkinella humicola]
METKQIIHCEADRNDTRFHLENGELYMVAKTLGDVREALEMGNFVRVHRQFIVNLDHSQKRVWGEWRYLLLSNGVRNPVSRQQKDRLMERCGWVGGFNRVSRAIHETERPGKNECHHRHRNFRPFCVYLLFLHPYP